MRYFLNLLFLICLSVEAGPKTSLQTLKAKIYLDSDKELSQPLLWWERNDTRTKEGVEVKTEFKDFASGEVLLREKVSYGEKGGSLVFLSSFQDNFQGKEEISSTMDGSHYKVTMLNKENGKEKKFEYAFKEDERRLGSDEIVPFIIHEAAALKEGTRFPFKYFVNDRMDFYSFELRRHESAEGLLSVHMRPMSLLIRMLIKSPEFLFTEAEGKLKIKEFTTRMPVKIKNSLGRWVDFRGRAILE